MSFARDVLKFLEARGFEGASFVAGVVVEDEAALSDDQIASAGRLLRRLHDVLAGSDLAGGEETVCHGDAGPHNVVFRGEEAVAFIDWEFAAPGSRLAELADVAWCLLDDRWESREARAASRRIDVFCRAYGWEDVDQVIDEVHLLVGRARDGHADQGLRASVDHFERLLFWLRRHDDELKAARYG